MSCKIKTISARVFSLVSKGLKMWWNGNKKATNTGTDIYTNTYDSKPTLLLLKP